MSTEVIRPGNVMLERLTVMYGAPETHDPAGYIREYERLLAGHADSELDEAATELISRRKYKSWPTPAECLEALKVVRQARANKRMAAQMAAKAEQKAAPRVVSEAERKEAEQFVDDCVAGKIDMGLCAESLRKLAIEMQRRRRQRDRRSSS